MNYIRKSFNRPEKDLIEKFKNIPTPILSDVMGRYRCMDNSIRPVYESARIVGTALTVKTYPSDNLMIHAGVKLAEPGDVLVVDAGGFTNAGLWGELLTLAAQMREIKGLVIDGGIRDCKEIEEMDFPVFSKGINARGGYKNNPGSINCTISCGGISVNPGDIIVGDENGVVVVPLENAYQVYEKAIDKLKAEEVIREKMNEGIELFDILNLKEQLEKLNIKTI